MRTINLGKVVGNDGRGIVSIIKTATSGLIDTYTITYTDRTTTTFNVTNGKDGSGDSNISVYELNETSIDQTVLEYIATNKPDILKVTTSYGIIQNYAKGEDNNYYSIISGVLAVLVISGSTGNYNLEANRYSLNNIKEVSGKSSGEFWTKLKIGDSTKNIPSEVTEQIVANWGFTKNTGNYSKPVSGIPETDLTKEVQDKLNSGSSNVSVKEIDYSNSEEWDSEEEQPTAEVIDDILENKYTFIHLYNIPVDEGTIAEAYLVINSMVDIENANNVRYYYKFDEGNEDEGTLPNIEQYLFIHQEGESAQMITENFELGGAGTTSWGSITGTLSSQTDLQNALDSKGTYSKPSGGIPETDLSEALQEKLNSGEFYADLDLTEDVNISSIQNGKYIVTVTGNIVDNNEKTFTLYVGDKITKTNNTILVYSDTDIKKIYDFNQSGQTELISLTLDDFNNNENCTVSQDETTNIISLTKTAGTWGVMGIANSDITLQLKASSRGLFCYKKQDNLYTLIQLVPAGTENAGKIGTVNRPLSSTSSNVSWTEPTGTVPQAWLDATTSSFFKIEKQGLTLTVSVFDGTGWITIFQTDDCNFIGFLDTSNSFSKILGYKERLLETKDISAFDGSTPSKGVTPDNMLQRFYDYSVLCIGDSITEKNFRASTNWTEYLNEWLKFNSILNDGKSGTGIVRPYSSTYKNWLDRIDDYSATSYDLILIMGNMNDYSGHIFDETNLGTYGDYSGTDVSTQYRAVKVFLDKLIAKYPTAKIGWITSTPRQYTDWEDRTLYGKTSPFEGAVKAIKDTCEDYSIPVLDLYHESNLMPWIAANNTKYFLADGLSTPDGVHPNAKGQKVMAYKIYDFVVKNF